MVLVFLICLVVVTGGIIFASRHKKTDESSTKLAAGIVRTHVGRDAPGETLTSSLFLPPFRETCILPVAVGVPYILLSSRRFPFGQTPCDFERDPLLSDKNRIDGRINRMRGGRRSVAA